MRVFVCECVCAYVCVLVCAFVHACALVSYCRTILIRLDDGLITLLAPLGVGQDHLQAHVGVWWQVAHQVARSCIHRAQSTVCC